MILSLSSLCVAGITLVLPAEKRVSGVEIDVGKVAEVSGGDAATLDRLRAFSLGYAPSPGYTRLIQSWQIERDLEAAFPDVDVTVAGARTCRVLPESQKLNGLALRDAAEKELRALFKESDVSIEAQGVPVDLEIPKPTRSSEIKVALEHREAHAGSWSIPVEVWIDDALYQRIWLAFRVELYRELPVLVRAIGRGEYLSPDAVEVRRIKVGAELAGRPLPAHALTGAVAARDLVPGSVLTDRDLERTRIVRQGDTVELQVKKGPITARSSAVARQDGFLGDKIRVSGANNKSREVMAVVIGRELVEIDLTPGR